MKWCVLIISFIYSVQCCSLVLHSAPWIQNLRLTNDTNLLSVDLWHPGASDDLLHGQRFVKTLFVNIQTKQLLNSSNDASILPTNSLPNFNQSLFDASWTRVSESTILVTIWKIGTENTTLIENKPVNAYNTTTGMNQKPILWFVSDNLQRAYIIYEGGVNTEVLITSWENETADTIITLSKYSMIDFENIDKVFDQDTIVSITATCCRCIAGYYYKYSENSFDAFPFTASPVTDSRTASFWLLSRLPPFEVTMVNYNTLDTSSFEISQDQVNQFYSEASNVKILSILSFVLVLLLL